MRKIHHLEAITVCVGYADLLQATAPWNVGHFDRWIVCTTPDDEKTRWVCNKYNLEVLLTDDGKRHARDKGGFMGATGFNKGRMIERALHLTSNEGWRLHIDADIALPHKFWQILEVAELKEEHVYGCDRANIKSYDVWKKVIESGYLQGGSWAYHCQKTFPKGVEFTVGDRWASPEVGYVPCGFFQLFHSSQDEWKGIRVKTYPTNHSSAARTDIQFGLKWDRHKRSLIPELIVVHLESERLPKGANWNGRTSKWFGPPWKWHGTDSGKPGSC